MLSHLLSNRLYYSYLLYAHACSAHSHVSYINLLKRIGKIMACEHREGQKGINRIMQNKPFKIITNVIDFYGVVHQVYLISNYYGFGGFKEFGT